MLQAPQLSMLKVQCLEGHQVRPVILLQTETGAQVSLELWLESCQQSSVHLQEGSQKPQLWTVDLKTVSMTLPFHKSGRAVKVNTCKQSTAQHAAAYMLRKMAVPDSSLA